MSALPKTPGHAPVPTFDLASELEGRVDAVANDRVYGWARDRASPDARVEIEVRLSTPEGERTVATGAADLARSDLQANGVGDGRHAFEIPLGAAGFDPAALMVVARSPATGTELVLQHPSEPERLVEQAVSPHLLRLNAAVQASRSEQQSLAVRQQGLMRAVADIQERVRAGAEVEAKLDRLAGEVAAMGERVAGIEVFLVRMDATLRDLGAAVRSGAPGGEGSMRKVALVALACGLAVGAIAFIILRAT